VDAGSAWLRAAVVDDTRVEPVLEPGTGAPRWASCALADGSAVGSAADALKRGWPEQFRTDLRGLPDHRLFVELLTTVRLEAEQHLGSPLARAVVGAPAGWPAGHIGRTRLIRTFETAGFRDVEVVAEEVAAVLDPAAGTPPDGAVVLVCDLGFRGTASAVRAGGPEGGAVLGTVQCPAGRDLDAVVRASVASVIHVPTGDDADEPDPGALRARFDLDELVSRLKLGISVADHAEDVLTPVSPAVRISRAGLVAATDGLAMRVRRACANALHQAGVTAGRLYEIRVVGGSAFLPLAVDWVGAAVPGVQARVVAEPDFSVVRGLAAFAAAAAGRQVSALPVSPRTGVLTFGSSADGARLERWRRRPGDRLLPGDTIAFLRTAGGAVVDLVSSVDGTLLGTPVPPGRPVTAGHAAAVVREHPDVADRRPQQLYELVTFGTWLLHDDTLVEHDPHGAYVRSRRVDTGAVVDEFVPDYGDAAARVAAGVFRDPDGRLVLVTLDAAGYFAVWDVLRRTCRLSRHEPHAKRFEVDEAWWRIALHGGLSRSVAVWDLRTGERLTATRRADGFTATSALAGFAEAARHDEAALRATVHRTRGAAGALVEDSAGALVAALPARPAGAFCGVAFDRTGDRVLLARQGDGDQSVVAWSL
jgi:hypothetical protein